MKKIIGFFAIAAITTSSYVYADDDSRNYYHHPKKDELLSSPVHLAKCPGIKIVEWRPSRVNTNLSKFDPKIVPYLNIYCELVSKLFPIIVKEKFNYDIKKVPLDVKISFIPSFSWVDGKEFRNLNDNTFRFSKFTREPGTYYSGYYIHADMHVYVGSEAFVLIEKNEKAIRFGFLRSFMHELLHVHSERYGLFYDVFKSNHEKDEAFVMETIDYITKMLKERKIIDQN